MARFLVLFLIVALFATSGLAVEKAQVPLVAVVDGDTLEVDGETVRLYGIDAPELGQFCWNGTNRYRCGFEAALKLRKLVAAGPVDCRPTPNDSRDEGQICAAGPRDLAEAMLRSGYAVARPSGLATYLNAEGEAKRSRVGIWRGAFVPPSEWRAGQRLQIGGDEPSQICDVKGTVSNAGLRVYLVPSDREYEAVDIDESRGERLFCSDDEAELAGWKRWPKSAVQDRSVVTN